MMLQDSNVEVLGFASVLELSFEVLSYNKSGISDDKIYLHILFCFSVPFLLKLVKLVKFNGAGRGLLSLFKVHLLRIN